jgi:hypothetical protein
VKDKDLFLLGLFRRRLEYPALKRAVREQHSQFNECRADRGQGLGHPADPGTDRRWLPCCHALPTDHRKIMRLHAQTAMIENGFVYIPQTAAWLAEYLHEMTVFPRGNRFWLVGS